MYVKVESFNPLASVKDRLALNIIEAAEREGACSRVKPVVEATLREYWDWACHGLRRQRVSPWSLPWVETFVERRRLMRMLGAKVVLTPKEEKGTGMVQKPATGGSKWLVFAQQFETAANADIHESTTGQEIVADFEGCRLDYWVTGYGTGGTVTGVARCSKMRDPTANYPLEPHNAALIGSGLETGKTGGWIREGQSSGLAASYDSGLDAGFHSPSTARER